MAGALVAKGEVGVGVFVPGRPSTAPGRPEHPPTTCRHTLDYVEPNAFEVNDLRRG